MKTELMIVTAKMAKDWLANNPNIRTIRPKRVAGFVRALQAGKFLTTHQGIAIGTRGQLLDGQHRLSAIAQSGISAKMLVSTGVPDVALSAIDGGLQRRPFERLGTNRMDTSIAACLLSILTSRSQPEPFEIALCLDVIQESLAECERDIRSWRHRGKTGSAPSLAAMLLLIASHQGHEDLPEMKQMISMSLSGDLVGAPYSVINFYKQMHEGVKSYTAKRDGRSGATDKFIRTWAAMQPKNKDHRKLLVKSPRAAIAPAVVAFNELSCGIFAADGGVE